MIGTGYDGWTPRLVGAQMIAAVRWVRRYGGAVGPASVRGSMPAFKAGLDDFLDEGWGLPECADDDEEQRPQEPLPSPEQVSRHIAALQWPAVYLLPRNHGAALMLNLWVGCKAVRRPFDAAVKARGTMSRGAAYALRDRGLSIISQKLQDSGIKP